MSKFDLVVFDLDGVLIDTKSSWEHVHSHFGVNNDESLAAYLAEQIDDLEFMRRDISLWKSNKGRVAIDEIKRIIETAPLMPGAIETLKELKRHGITIAIISGGIDLMAQRITSLCEIDYVFANGLECDRNGILTGEGIAVVPVGKKDVTLKKLLKDTKIPPERVVAIGDGIVDVCMFEIAGLGIAFNPRDGYTIEGADIVIDKKDLREILKYIID
jgi:phosphoserine phosphatase